MNIRQFSVLLTSIAVLSLLFTSYAAAETHDGQTFTVTATTDVVDALPGDGVCETASGNGMCTLRAAIMETNALIGADTIILPDASYPLTIPGADEDQGATGDLDITDQLTIVGAEDTWSSIFATGLGDRVLDIHSSASSVSVTWIYLGDGEESDGGGIRNTAALELTHVNIVENHAAYGGGIYSTHVLDLIEVHISSNSASYSGGGIYNLGVLRAQNSFFKYNSAVQNGGGAYTKSPYYQEFENTEFMDNDADSGAGIYNETDLTLIGSVILSNDATSNGGGIYNLGEVTSRRLRMSIKTVLHSLVGGPITQAT